MRKLLKQALIALEGAVYAGKTIERYADPRLRPLSETGYRTLLKLGYGKELLVDRAIDAIRAELAKTEPEPVAWIYLPHSELLWPNEVEASNPSELDEYMPLYAKEKTE